MKEFWESISIRHFIMNAVKVLKECKAKTWYYFIILPILFLMDFIKSAAIVIVIATLITIVSMLGDGSQVIVSDVEVFGFEKFRTLLLIYSVGNFIVYYMMLLAANILAESGILVFKLFKKNEKV